MSHFNKKVSESTDEEILGAILESLDEAEVVISEDELKSKKEIFFEQFVSKKFKLVMEGFDLSSLSVDDAAGVFKAGFNGAGMGKRNPYPQGHALAKIWDAGATACREVDSAWSENNQAPDPTHKPRQAPLPVAKPVAQPAAQQRKPSNAGFSI